MIAFLAAFLPELALLTGALGLFAATLGPDRGKWARRVALATAAASVFAAALALGSRADLFGGAYRVDAFSQLLKLLLAGGFACVLLLGADLPDIRDGCKPEYYLFLTLNVAGLALLVSCVDLIALVVALELSSFPLYLLVPMRRERAGQTQRRSPQRTVTMVRPQAEEPQTCQGREADALPALNSPRIGVALLTIMMDETAVKIAARSSALVDTRVIYCGDNLEQLKKLPNACVDLIYIADSGARRAGFRG